MIDMTQVIDITQAKNFFGDAGQEVVIWVDENPINHDLTVVIFDDVFLYIAYA